MSARNVLESQQSVHAATAGRRAAACWKLATGQAPSLHPTPMACCRSPRGRRGSPCAAHWRTCRAPPWTMCCSPAKQLTVAPGQHVVMEAWSGSGCEEPVAFRWDVQAAPALAQPASTAARDGNVAWCSRCATGQGGRALGTALAGVAGAGGRFAAGSGPLVSCFG